MTVTFRHEKRSSGRALHAGGHTHGAERHGTYPPPALGEILPDLGADGLVDVLAQGCVTGDPETEVETLLQRVFGVRGHWSCFPWEAPARPFPEVR